VIPATIEVMSRQGWILVLLALACVPWGRA
jgi:cytosine/uracil/thiamine/allantoin permease